MLGFALARTNHYAAVLLALLAMTATLLVGGVVTAPSADATHYRSAGVSLYPSGRVDISVSRQYGSYNRVCVRTYVGGTRYVSVTLEGSILTWNRGFAPNTYTCFDAYKPINSHTSSGVWFRASEWGAVREGYRTMY